MFELHSPTLLSPLIQNILENISLSSPKRSLNYISLPLMLKYALYSLNIYFFVSNNLVKQNNLTHFEEK